MCFGRGTPKARRAEIRPPSHQLEGLGESCKLPQRGFTQIDFGPPKSLENASSGRKCRAQFHFLLSTSGPADPLDTTGGTPRFRGTPVEKHWRSGAE